jgi:hypothetical protein
MTKSKSGVRLYDDLRDSLIIDRYHPELLTMSGSKRDGLRSANFEDALTWNVFRSLEQIDPTFWLPLLHKKVFPTADPPPVSQFVLTHFWMEMPSRHDRDDGLSQIDVVIETEGFVWFIETKFKSDSRIKTTSDGIRDQMICNLDVGSSFARGRDFYFALLIMDEENGSKSVEVLEKVWPQVPPVRHRPDGMKNIKGCGWLPWREVAAVLHAAADGAPRDDERGYARRAVGWMGERGLS